MRKNNKAYTLLEVLLAVFIFSLVALPLLGIFVQAVKTDVVARNVLNANYIAQNYIEQLYSSSYKQALSSLPNKQLVNGYYLSATILPYGNQGDLFPAPCGFAHLILSSDGKMLSVMPDGAWRLFGSVPSNISLSVSGGVYTLDGDGTQISGSCEQANCTLIVNAVLKPETSASPTITLGQGCKAIAYCTRANKDSVSIVADAANVKKHVDIITGTSSLINVKANVYDTTESNTPVGTAQAYISIKN